MSKIADAFVEIKATGMSAFEAAMARVKGWLDKIASAAKTFSTAFGTAFDSVLFATEKLVYSIGGKLASAMGWAVDQVFKLGGAFTWLAGKAVNAVSSLGGLASSAVSAAGSIASSLAGAIVNAKNAIGPALNSLGTFIGDNWKQILSSVGGGTGLGFALFGGIIASVPMIVGGLGAAIASVGIALWPAQIGGALVSAFTTARNAIGGQFGGRGGGGGGGHEAPDRWVRVLPLVVRVARQLEMGIDRIARGWAHIGRAVRDVRRIFAGVVAILRLMVQIVQRFLTRLALAYPQIAPILAAWRSAARGSASAWDRAMNQIRSGTNGAVGRVQQAAQSIGSAFRLAADAAQLIPGPWGTAIRIAIGSVRTLASVFFSVSRIIVSALRTVVRGLLSIASTAYRVGRTIVSALTAPLRFLYNQIFSMRGVIASLVGTISVAMVGRYIAKWTADAENAQVSFKVLLGSAGQAVTMLKQLQDLADKTPLQLPEVRDAAKHLLAMGVQATQVTDTIRRLGDVSQGLGLDLNHVADIYGKVSQANRLTGEDMRRFRLNGIPIARELAIMLGKSTQEIEHMAHTGTLRFGDVEKVFRKMTDQGGLFFNLMKEKGQTLGGLFSTIQDSLRNLAVYFGEGMAPAVKNIERRVISFLDNAKDAIWPLRNQFRLMAEELANNLPAALKFIVDAIPTVTEGIKTARAIAQALREIVVEIGTGILTWAGGAAAVSDGLTMLLKKVRFLASEWQLVWQIAKTRMQLFVLDWKNEMTSAFTSFAVKITPAMAIIGKILADAFRGAVNSLMMWLIEGFAAIAPKLVMLLTPGGQIGAIASLMKMYDKYADFFKNGPGEGLGDMLNRLLPKPDKEAANAKQKELAALMDQFNAAFKKFLNDDELQKINDALRKAAEEAAKTKAEPLVDKPGLPGGGSEDRKKNKFAFTGLQEYHKQIQQGISGDVKITIARQSLAEQKRIAKLTEKTNSLLQDRMVPRFG